jgi:hypothetical protein
MRIPPNPFDLEAEIMDLRGKTCTLKALGLCQERQVFDSINAFWFGLDFRIK